MTVEELRNLKKELGYSNRKVSEVTGVSIGTVNKVFSGATANPRIDTLKQIAGPLLSTLRREKEESSIYSISENASSNLLLREASPANSAFSEKNRFSIDDYSSLSDDRRAELFEGEFFDMASPNVIHQRIVRSLCYQFETFIRSNKGTCELFQSPIDVQPDPADDHTMLQPDVIVVCDPSKISKNAVIGAPDFIAEVVSPSSIRMDYYKKAYKYENSGVREYWIIDPLKKTVLVNRFEKNEPPMILPLVGFLEVSVYDGNLKIDLDEIMNCIQ